MEYVRFGKLTGLKVSKVALGTMTFGRETDEQTSFAIMDRYTELGGNFFDCADMYAKGASEEIIGRWLKDRGARDQTIIATKVYNAMGSGPNDRGLTRLHIQQGVEASLRRLGVDVIDLYQIHRWDVETPIEETLSALNDLVVQGKVRYLGASNLAAWQLCQYRELAKRNGLAPFISLQPAYSAINRAIENEILPYCMREGVAVMVFNPLGGGMLTGKYRRGEDMPAEARLTAFGYYYDRYYTEQSLTIVEQFLKAAEERNVTPAQLGFAWVLADPRITCPIIGARNLDQFNDTIQALNIKLTPEEREAIPAVPAGRWVGKDLIYDNPSKF